MSSSHVWSVYGARAREYTAAFGHTEATVQEDRRPIARQARGVQGRVVDLGRGPGHWTAYLHDLGLQVERMDSVKSFTEIVRDQYPHVTYRWDSPVYLPAGFYGAVLAWYSLVHIPPQELPGTPVLLRDSFTPRENLFIGSLIGDRAERFPHATAPAYY